MDSLRLLKRARQSQALEGLCIDLTDPSDSNDLPQTSASSVWLSHLSLSLSLFFFGLAMQLRDLNSPARDQSLAPALEAWRPSHWTVRKAPLISLLSLQTSLPPWGPSWLSVLSRSAESSSLRPHRLYPPGSSALGILQARILEWVAVSSSKHWADVS